MCWTHWSNAHGPDLIDKHISISILSFHIHQDKTTMRTILFGLSVALFSTVAIAQDSVEIEPGSATTKPHPEHYASLRAQTYNDALGLSKEQLAKMNEIFLQGEQSLVELRSACREAQAKIGSTMQEHERKAESMLTKEQQAKLLALRTSGDFNSEIPSCMPATMGDCKHSAACCSGSKNEGEKKMGERPKLRVQDQATPEITAPE